MDNDAMSVPFPFRHKLVRLIGLAALPLLGCAGPAWGAEPDEAALLRLAALSLDELINLPITTASRQLESLVDTPAHVRVITRQQIQERRYRNLADLLEDLPGVDFMRGTKSSAYNNFAVQGYAGPNRLLIMQDGVRVGHPAGGNIPVAENFALYHARQVEVVFGPAAALYGADAVAGVINIITDRPRDHQGAWVSLGAGDFGSREASFMAGLKTEHNLALSMGGHWQRSKRASLDKYFHDEFAKVDATTFSGTVVVPAADREDYVGNIASHSFHARLDLGDDLSFGYYRNYFCSLTSTGDPPATAIYDADAHWQTTTDTVWGKYRFNLGAAVSGELVVDYSLQEVAPSSRYHNIYTAFTEGNEYVRGERLAVEQNLSWVLGDRHRVQAGLGYQSYYAIEAHSLPASYDTDEAPDEQGQTYANTGGAIPISIYDARYYNASLYAQLQSVWSEGFSTMAGGRFDRHSSYGSSFNPRLGAVWHPADAHYLKLLYGEAFRAPSPEETLSAFGSFTGETDGGGNFIGRGFRIPNFNLEPETTRTLSLTWDWRPRPALNLVLNVYHSEAENLIVTLPSDAVDAIPGAVLVAPETKGNAGKEVHTGFDLMGQWRFRINNAWSGDLWGSYSRVWGSIDEGDGVKWDLAYVADHKVKLGATLRYLDRLTLSPRLLWIGDTHNGRKLSGDAPHRRVTPGYAVMDLHVGWHKLFDANSTLWLDVYNLFDKRYYAAGGAGSRTFYDMPQQPRTLMVTLEYRF
jgi:outer membrane receptor for ferrienterochelin and colicins